MVVVLLNNMHRTTILDCLFQSTRNDKNMYYIKTNRKI